VLFKANERSLATEIGALVYANPFLEERIAHERAIIGNAYVDAQPYLDAHIKAISAKCVALVETLHARMRGGTRPSGDERQVYEDLIVYFLYDRYEGDFYRLVVSGGRADFYPRFRADASTYLIDASVAAHLFACFYQVRRAFHQIFRHIVGRTKPAARLRAGVWQSIFTHDVRRYRRSLYERMADVATLITGPTGTGKELVARAIGTSRYIPFDEKRERFADAAFVAVNLSALSPTLIESELFGHRKGSFTGAATDREGFLESTGTLGTVFLDEIGEVDPSVQVKLLRVIQARTFQRLGETTARTFGGKLIAATSRDLAAEIAQGRFREDFYYRLCADTLVTPSLQEQLAGSDDELEHLVRFIAARVAGEEEAEALTREVMRAIPKKGYAWPGNFRELEQAVRSVMLRGTYSPHATAHTDARQRVARGVVAGHFTADELLRHYATLLYASTRNYSEVAQRLGVDRRTVRAKIDHELLREL